MLSIFAVVLLVSAYLFAHRLESFSRETSSAFASFSGGVASAYVFLFILPKLASQQAVLEQTTSEWPFMEYLYHHAYIVALIGFTTYYLTSMVNYVNQNGLPFDGRAKLGLFMLALYAATIGEVTALQQQAAGTTALLLTSALFIHLLGLNFLLSAHMRSSWQWIRGILAASFVAGWLVGNFFQASLGISALLSAWMAGSIIIHVVMIELPEKRTPLAFISGVLVFTLLLKLYLNLQGIDRGI